MLLNWLIFIIQQTLSDLTQQEHYGRLDFNVPLHAMAISKKYFTSHRSTDQTLLKSLNQNGFFIPYLHTFFNNFCPFVFGTNQ